MKHGQALRIVLLTAFGLGQVAATGSEGLKAADGLALPGQVTGMAILTRELAADGTAVAAQPILTATKILDSVLEDFGKAK